MSTLTPPQAAPSWDFNPDQLVSLAEKYVSDAKATDDLVVSAQDPSIESVLKPYAAFSNENQGLVNQLTFLQHVSDNKELRDASTKAEKLIRDFGIESSMREDLYKVFKKVYEDTKDSTEVNDESKRYLQKTNNEFRRNGLALPLDKREKVKDIQKQLSDLSLEFSKNLGENKEHILFTKEELEGVPEDVVGQFEQVDGKLKMTFKYPDVLPTMKYAKNPETRKRAFLGDQNKNADNEALLVKAVQLRRELAKLLGYETFSDYVLEERMAKDTKTVKSFLKDLRSKLEPLGIKERESLIALKKADYEANGLQFDNEYYVWDHRYYDNLMVEKDYQIDQQKISEYFPMNPTIDKMLSFFEKLFNLKFVETKENKSTWHQDAKQFAVWNLNNASSPEFVGWLYFDLHPRDGKYGHAANFGLYPGYTKEDGSRSYPVTALVCNFSKPTKEKPSLLKHDEVTTFFHELGHGIHDLMGKTQYAKFHGTSVSWDFVEAPSQMLEYWTWSPNELKLLSEHYESGKQIDDELVESLIKTKHVNGGLFNLRQLHFGLFDITIHSSDEDIDLAKFWNELRAEVSLLSNGDSVSKGYQSFGHIMGGYQAGYYGYMWSQVFAADIYYSKFKADPMNTANGVEYRDTVLARGGSRDEMDNLKELLGREPNNAAFSKELGLSV
ncbi:Saccharolysin [Cyberlindnera fabianii]|uniref:Saccharolysin n=1 Tax=Cyberlindnera fabianii TaxID=36022 RepID=A0A1V2KZ20_CYBFA|nr:Saccharolysin [Cyberlindnera fabianii]